MRVLLTLLLGLFTTSTAFACMCLPLTFDEEVKESEYIFHGRVIAVDGDTFTIEVIESWKGKFTSKITRLLQGTTSCNRRTFDLEKDYLFYVRNSTVSNCNRTTEFQLTIDTELLDLLFKNTGNKKLIESEKLTAREEEVLKKILEKKGVLYPPNLTDSTILFTFEGEVVSKVVFFEANRWSPHQIKIMKMSEAVKNDTGNTGYIFWTGYNWDKSFRKIKRRLKTASV